MVFTVGGSRGSPMREGAEPSCGLGPCAMELRVMEASGCLALCVFAWAHPAALSDIGVVGCYTTDEAGFFSLALCNCHGVGGLLLPTWSLSLIEACKRNARILSVNRFSIQADWVQLGAGHPR